jgi:hypothetical protein
VRSFYEEYVELLATLGIEVHIWTTPVEVPAPIPFERDDMHHEYDATWAHRFWQVLRRCDAAFRELAASYVGKQSPVHFFWGSFDLAATRYSGRRAPDRPGADRITLEAYSHEVISFGFWPGGATPSGVSVNEPVLYAYAAPEPRGFADADLGVPAARYDERLGEFLPYDAIRTAPDPAAVVRKFCESAYDAGATLGGWDRDSLERRADGRSTGCGGSTRSIPPVRDVLAGSPRTEALNVRAPGQLRVAALDAGRAPRTAASVLRAVAWVHLRLCMTCGHVGCCDSSPNKHASRHFHATRHPVVKSFEPGEDWAWCYADLEMAESIPAFPAESPSRHY